MIADIVTGAERRNGARRRPLSPPPGLLERLARKGAAAAHLPLLLLGLALAACTSSTPAGTGQIPPDVARTATVSQPPIHDYTLAPGDKLEFRVVGDETMDTVQQVRADGRITLPMIDDQVVSGLTLQELRKRLQKQYVDQGFLQPSAANGINMIIVDSAANKFFVGGQVKKEGVFIYAHPTTVTRSIFEAGGMELTADPTRVVLIRQDGTYQVVDVKKILAGNFQDDIQLRPMDTVYVPTSTIGDIDAFVQLYIKNVLPISPGVGVAF
jgi:protein involved in polysaccharide export with SLBB domain